MKLKIRDDKTGGDLLLFKYEDGFDRLYFSHQFHHYTPRYQEWFFT
jgi:hypothetical protein